MKLFGYLDDIRPKNIFMAQKNDKLNLIALFRHFEKL